MVSPPNRLSAPLIVTTSEQVARERSSAVVGCLAAGWPDQLHEFFEFFVGQVAEVLLDSEP
ncbi:hypothetical protein [Mycobacterium senriense]|uniref:hypothetical protein n=1 Tax=Mycobacterium senriense TaxID=2775496 RepID=UPI001C8089E5|nr:hypothetical protein [Mycobacterium senriense]